MKNKLNTYQIGQYPQGQKPSRLGVLYEKGIDELS